MPAYTSHGHEIPRSVENHPKPQIAARCGGPGVCAQCSFEVSQWKVPEKHTEGTLFKVLRALLDSGLDNEQAISAIGSMQAAGILFREMLCSTRTRCKWSLPVQIRMQFSIPFAEVMLSAGDAGLKRTSTSHL